MLTNGQAKLINGTALAVFALLLVIAALLFFYTYVARSGDPGNWLTDAIEEMLLKQQNALAACGTIVTALPAAALSLATDSDGQITRSGRQYLVLLIPTFLISVIASILLDPESVALGRAVTPGLADSTCLRVSGYCLTLITAIFGLKLGGVSNSVSPDAKEGEKR